MLAYNIKKQELVEKLSKELKSVKEVKAPDWAKFVKTGVSKEFPPVDNDWWYFRTASIFRKVAEKGPIGVSKLRNDYGSKKNRGYKPERFFKASGNIIRKSLQQLETAGFVKQDKKGNHKGRILTPQGEKFLNKTAKAKK